MSNPRRSWLRPLRLAVGAVTGVLWLMAGIYTALEFVVGYGSPLGTYTGQEDDRRGAWIMLCVLLALSIILILGARFTNRIIRRVERDL